MLSRVYLTALGCALAVSIGGCCKDKPSSSSSEPTTAGSAVAPLLAPKEVKPAADPNKTYKVGDTATHSDYKLEVVSAKECTSKGYIRPKKGMKWIGVEVSFEGLGDKTFHATPSTSKITDSEGVVHNWAYAGKNSCGDSMNGTQLNKGEKAKGWIFFEVPTAAKGLKMTFKPLIFGEDQSSKFDLGL